MAARAAQHHACIGRHPQPSTTRTSLRGLVTLREAAFQRDKPAGKRPERPDRESVPGTPSAMRIISGGPAICKAKHGHG